MNTASTIARYVLGLMFTVLGLNGFLQFLPMAPVPPLAGRFLEILGTSHYMVPVFSLQLVCGLLFLSGRYVPLALTLIAPVIVNILLYHGLMNPGGILPGLLAAVCWLLVFYRVRVAFAGILSPQVPEPESRRP